MDLSGVGEDLPADHVAGYVAVDGHDLVVGTQTGERRR